MWYQTAASGDDLAHNTDPGSPPPVSCLPGPHDCSEGAGWLTGMVADQGLLCTALLMMQCTGIQHTTESGTQVDMGS